MIRGGGVATDSMPLAHKHPSEEARKNQQPSHASRTSDVPAQDSYNNSGWKREYSKGQELKARVVLNQRHIDGLRKDWETGSDAEEGEEGECAEQSDEAESTDESDEEGGEDDDLTGEEIELETSVAKVFLRSNVHVVKVEPAEPWPEGTRGIEKHYGDIQFEDLMSLNPKAKPTAIIEEISRAGAYRKNKRPMNLFKLRNVLHKLRYEKPSGLGLPGLSDVDQRRLCIFDPTPKAAAVLMETCSSNDAEALPQLFDLHLNRKPSAGVSFPSRNVSCFAFHLSLPFYTSISETRPNRGSPQQQILRITGLGDFIIGHRTLVLVGVDEERWTAIALVDGSSRRALAPDRDKHNFQQLRKDPITGTEFFSPNPSVKARLYFPWLWKAWIEEVRRRWAEVVGVIIDGIQEKNKRDAFLATSDKPGVIQELTASIATAAQWDKLLTAIHADLSGIIDTWKQFERCGSKCFYDESMPLDDVLATRDSLQSIEDVYVVLEMLLKQLEGSIDTLGRPQLNNVLAARIGSQGLGDGARSAFRHERIALGAAKKQEKAAERAVRSQEIVAKSSWKATITTMALLPFMLAFTLFSMEASAIPVKASFHMLVYSFLAFTFAIFFLFNFLDTLLTMLGDLLRAGGNFLLPKATPPPERQLEARDDSDDPDWDTSDSPFGSFGPFGPF